MSLSIDLYSHSSQFSCQSMSLSISRVTHHSSAVSPCHNPSLESHITVQLSVHVTIHQYSHTSQFSCQSKSLSICTVSHHSRVTFKAQLKVGWQPKYYIECYIPNCLSYPEVYESTRNNWPLLVRAEKSRMASKMAARGCLI